MTVQVFASRMATLALAAGLLPTLPAHATDAAPATAPAARPLPECARYAPYMSRVELSATPLSVCQRVEPALWGLRSTLADTGWGIGLVSILGYTYDVNGHDAKPQAYNGQDPSYNQSTSLYATYDLARIGFSKDAQFTFSANWATSSYEAANPHVKSMTLFAVDQPLFGRQVELVYGFVPGARLFYGMTLGGNASSSALGPQSVVPFQVGMSASEPTPTLDVVVRDPSLRFYDSFAITRSSSPQGILKDIDLNSSGFRLKVPGAGALFINELGYRRAASATESASWIRLGTPYNTSAYTRYDATTKSSNNYEVYLAGTQQVSSPWHDARGLYVDAKLDWSPADRNAINRAVQASAFYLGPFAGRPFDMVAAGATRSFYSPDLRDAYAAYRMPMAKATSAYTASYAARLVRGVYLISGLTYTQDPVFVPRHPDALLLQETLTFTF